MRDMASVCTVDKEWNLEGKTKVHGISFKENGYEAMVSKDIKPGMLVAFIQEDSLLPAEFDENGNPIGTWSYLYTMKCYVSKLNKYLIKVKRFKEIQSWGLCLRLDELGLDEKTISKLKAGDDITELLHIQKYEPLEVEATPSKNQPKKPNWVRFCMKHKMLRWVGKKWLDAHKMSSEAFAFPTNIINISDETTIQNYKRALDIFKEDSVYVSLKMEGCSGTFLLDENGSFYVCSRLNAYKTDNGNEWWRVAKELDIDNKIHSYLKDTGMNLVIQGEVCGPGIQSNIYHFDRLHLFVYTIIDQNTGRALSEPELVEVCKKLGLETVPIIMENVKLSSIMPDMDSAVVFAEKQGWVIGNLKGSANGEIWKDWFQHEGVVVRTMDYDKKKHIGCSFKVKNIDYKMKTLPVIAKIALQEYNSRKI